MSVGAQISEAIDKMQSADARGALFQLCAAIDDTATREAGGAGGRRVFKEFLHRNLGIITDISGGFQILNLRLKYDHPEKDCDGTVTIEDILYHVVRCELYHTTRIPQTLNSQMKGNTELRTMGFSFYHPR